MTAARTTLRKRELRAAGGTGDVLAQRPIPHGPGQSRDGPAAMTHRSGAGWGRRRGEPVRPGGCGRRVGRSREGWRRARRATGSTGRDRTGSAGRPASRRSTGHGTPTAGSSQAKPSSSEPSNSFVTRYSSSSGSRARKPWATPVGITTQSSALSSRVSTGARRPRRTRRAGRRRARRRRGRSPRPSSRAGGGGSGARAGRRPPSSRGWPGRIAAPSRRARRSPRRVSAGNADARHSSRNAPRLSPCRTSRPSGRRAAPSRSSGGPHRAALRGARGASARSRRAPPATAAAARRPAAASARGRPRPAASTPAARSPAGPPRSRRPRRPAGTARGPSRHGTRTRRSRRGGAPPTSPEPEQLDDRLGDVVRCTSASPTRRATT